MGMVENEQGNFGESFKIDVESQAALEKLKDKIETLKGEENLHFGIKDELDRHKQVIERIDKLENKINRMLIHFNLAKDKILTVD